MTRLRSLLFVPGDSARKLARAAIGDADAIILDLEDSVVAARKPAARVIVRAALDRSERTRPYWVRINALDSGETLADLAAVAGGAPDTILLPKANGASDVATLDHYLSAIEVREGLPVGGIKVAVVATETAAAMFGLGSYAPGCPRLTGLTWGAEDLAAAVGAVSNRDAQGQPTPLYQLARALCLAAAGAAGVTAIDTACMDIRDTDTLAAECDAARRDGFRAKLAIHPDQVAVINRAFTPSAMELDQARAIVGAFAARPEAGAFQLDGRMIDIPHLKQARETLASAGEATTWN